MEALWQLFFDIIGDTLQYRSSGAPFIGGVKVDVFLTSQLFAETEHLGNWIIPSFLMMQVCALLLLLTSSLLGSGGKNLSSGIFAKMSSQLLQLKPRKGHENRSKSKQTNKSRWPELQNVTDVKILAKYWGKSLGEHAISDFVKMKPFSGTFTNLCEVSLYKLA